MGRRRISLFPLPWEHSLKPLAVSWAFRLSACQLAPLQTHMAVCHAPAWWTLCQQKQHAKEHRAELSTAWLNSRTCKQPCSTAGYEKDGSLHSRRPVLSLHALPPQVPFIFKLDASRKFSASAMDIERSNRMQFETVGQVRYPWSAEYIAEFFTKTG